MEETAGTAMKDMTYLVLSGKVLDDMADMPAFGMIAMSRKSGQKMLDLIAKSKQLAAEIPEFAHFEVYDDCEWFEAVSGALAEKITAARVEKIDEVVNGDLSVTEITKEEYDAVWDTCPTFRTECDRMMVWQDHVVFTGYLKYADHIEVESCRIEEGIVQLIASGEKVPDLDESGEVALERTDDEAETEPDEG